MTANVITPEQLAHARELDQMLHQLQGELDASVNPHRLAMRQLGVNAAGATKSPYNDAAFTIWNQQQSRAPDDLETLHHLAIMHHARAFDREHSSPKEAESDWQTALKYWRQLFASDVFWQRVIEQSRATAKPDPIHELRRQLPELLLQIHFDLGFDHAHQKRIARSNFHIKLALDSAFPAEAKANVRRRTYELFTKDIPSEVWQSNVLDPAIIKAGTDRIEAYLQVDPGCLPALIDAAKLQVRLLRAWSNELRAEGEESQQNSPTITKLKQAADYWGKYLDQLIPVARELDEDVRGKVALWYRIMGDVHRRLKRLEEASVFYRKGVQVTLEQDEERTRCEREYCEARAFLARDLAHTEGKSNARATCDQVAQLPGLSAISRVILAQAYVALDQHDIAEKLCRDGLDREPDESDFEDMEQYEQGREHLTKMLENIAEARQSDQALQLMKQGIDLYQAGKSREALVKLNQAVKLDPEIEFLYLHRARCLVVAAMPAQARADLNRFQQSAPHWPPEQKANLRKAVDSLSQEIDGLERDVNKWGKEVALLRQSASDALRAEEFADAVNYLREALKKCPITAQVSLKPEIAAGLLECAMQSAGSALAAKEPDPDQAAPICSQAVSWLEEAAKLNPANAEITRILGILRERIENLQHEAQLLRELGSRKLFKSFQEAVIAFNDGDFPGGIEKMRKALVASGGSRQRFAIPSRISGGSERLRKELSKMLAVVAAPAAKLPVKNATALEQAREAVDLDPANQYAQTLLIVLNSKPLY